MQNSNNIQPVAGKFIQRGIAKYNGIIDETLLDLLKRSDCNYVPYKFSDGRYLLVQTETNFGFLYPNIDIVYKKLVLE